MVTGQRLDWMSSRKSQMVIIAYWKSCLDIGKQQLRLVKIPLPSKKIIWPTPTYLDYFSRVDINKHDYFFGLLTHHPCFSWVYTHHSGGFVSSGWSSSLWISQTTNLSGKILIQKHWFRLRFLYVCDPQHRFHLCVIPYLLGWGICDPQWEIFVYILSITGSHNCNTIDITIPLHGDIINSVH